MQATRPNAGVHRAPRKWPYIPAEPITIQAVQSPNKPSSTAVLVAVASLVGLVVAAFVYSRAGAGSGSSTLIVGFLAVSGLSMLVSGGTAIFQQRAAKADARELARRYTAYLDATQKTISTLAAEEYTARAANDPSIPEMLTALSRHPELVWQRQPSDPDFLAARIGMGDATPWLQVTLADNATPFALPAKDSAIREQQERARQLAEAYRLARNVPLTIPLRDHAAIALVSDDLNVAGASALACAMVGQVALHHAPNDVHLTVFAPERLATQWSWVRSLPTVDPSPRRARLSDEDQRTQRFATLASLPDERQQRLAALLEELSRRQQALSTRRADGSQQKEAPLPHLLIVVDSFAEGGRRDENDPLQSPALALALQHGRELGATVLSVHAARQQAPAQATLAAHVAQKRVNALGPEPAAETLCTTLDGFDVTQGQYIARVLEHLALEAQASLELPGRVPLLPLLDPPINIAEDYPIAEVWKRSSQRLADTKGKRAFPIPLGLKLGNEPLHLDFIADGPHGLLIGQTGSGKSELLRSIIAALAVQYSPDQVNLVLVDYKGGLAFDAYGALPHTVAYLTNMVQPGQTTRFLDMLDAEIVRRQAAHTRKEPQPELFVIIDEFAEMVSRRSSNDTSDIVLDKLLSIARLGRELGVHLLFAAQRPEGSVIQRLRGYVQYRICLRTNTEEDSREVINTPDAARLPVGAPGRGYLQRGDNELILFQAAQVTIPSFQSGTIHISRGGVVANQRIFSGNAPKTADRIVADRMQRLTGAPVAARWPVPLPEPTLQEPTPLLLMAGAAPSAARVWDAQQYASLRALEVPLGLYDRPAEQRQDWYIADLLGHDGRMHGGPLLVMGDLNAGKTTAMQTLLLALAQKHGPAQLRWFILNPNGSLSDFAALPQSRDANDPTTSNVIDGQDAEAFRAFANRYARMAQQDPNSRPAMLLVVDDYDELATQLSSTGLQKDLQNLATLAIRGRSERRLYLAVTAARASYSELPTALIGNMATRIALYMSDREQVRNVISGRPPAAMDATPGRGLIQTRRSLDAIQIAAPVAGMNDAERLERLEEEIRRAAQRWQ